jgi:hypothetical protein
MLHEVTAKRSNAMNIREVKVTGSRVLAKATDVVELEKEWWVKFPAGYAEFVTRVGEGLLGGFVRVYGPWRVELERDEWRRRVMRYWFWGDESRVLPKNRGVECVVIGDTVNGDEIVFHPTQPGRLFVLPRDLDEAFEIEGGLLEAVEWICRSGELVEPIESLHFEPFDSRKGSAKERPGARKDPPGESLDEIIDMAKSWVNRHKLKAKAKAVLAEENKRGADVEILYEGLIYEGGCNTRPGYGIGWRLENRRGRKSIQRILFTGNEDGWGWTTVL